MDKKNITTANMTAIMDEIDARNAKLRELIASGNITTLKDFMQAYHDAQFHFAARFEIARLEGYKNKLAPLADRYNMTGQLDNINAKIANAEQYAREGYKYQNGEFNQVWSDIKGAGKDIQQTAKDINAERMKERQNNRTQRQLQNGQRSLKIPGRDGRGPRNMSGNITGNNNSDNTSGVQ